MANDVSRVRCAKPQSAIHKIARPGITTALIPTLSTRRPPIAEETAEPSACGNRTRPAADTDGHVDVEQHPPIHKRDNVATNGWTERRSHQKRQTERPHRRSTLLWWELRI